MDGMPGLTGFTGERGINVSQSIAYDPPSSHLFRPFPSSTLSFAPREVLAHLARMVILVSLEKLDLMYVKLLQ